MVVMEMTDRIDALLYFLFVDYLTFVMNYICDMMNNILYLNNIFEHVGLRISHLYKVVSRNLWPLHATVSIWPPSEHI